VLAAQLAGANASAQEQSALQADLNEHIATLQKALEELQSAQVAALRESLEKVRPHVTAYAASAHRLVDAALAGKADGAQRREFDDSFAVLEGDLEKLSAVIEGGAAASVQQKAALYDWAKKWLIGAIVFSGALVIAFAIVFARTTMRRLGAEPAVLRDFAQRIADGVLHARMDGTVAAHSVADAMLRMRDTLVGAVQKIRGNAEEVASASAQIAQPARRLPKATPTCPRAPSSKPVRWSKPLRPWSSSQAPSNKTRTTRAKPMSSRTVPQTWPAKAAKWWVKWCTPCGGFKIHPRKFPTSSA